MKIINGTDLAIKIETGDLITEIPAGGSSDIAPESGKISVYSEKQTSTRVEEDPIKLFHGFYANIATVCTANISKFLEPVEITVTCRHEKFQTSTEYDYFILKCGGNILKDVHHEACEGDMVLSNREKFYSDYKAEKNVNSIFGFFNKIDDFFSDIMLILLIGLFSLPFTLKLTSSLIFTGIVLGLYLILLLPFGGLKRSLRRSNVKAMQTFFKKSDEPDDLKYFIKHINKYCK